MTRRPLPLRVATALSSAGAAAVVPPRGERLGREAGLLERVPWHMTRNAELPTWPARASSELTPLTASRPAVTGSALTDLTEDSVMIKFAQTACGDHGVRSQT